MTDKEVKITEKDLLTIMPVLNKALKNSNVRIFKQDKNLEYVWVLNPHPSFNMIGLEGKTESDILTPKDAKKLIWQKEQVLKTKKGNRQIFQITMNGEKYYYDRTIEPILERKKVVGIIGISVDVTEMIKSKKSLDFVTQKLLENQQIY